MIYYANDADGINKAVSGLESVIDTAVAADTTLTKGSADSIPDWVIPNKAQLVSGVWVRAEQFPDSLVDEETNLTFDQLDRWALEGKAFKKVVSDKIDAYITGGRQAAKRVYESTVSNKIKVTFMRNLREGSLDGIDSTIKFAAAADAYALPTNILSWASTTTGAKLNLATAENLGPLVATFKDHDRSFIS